MKFKTQIRIVSTPKALNLGLGILGLILVWFSTHSIIGLLATFVAGIHVEFVHATGNTLQDALRQLVAETEARGEPCCDKTS